MSTEARRELQEKERAARAEKRCRVAVCGAAGCLSNGGQAVREALDKAVKEAGRTARRSRCSAPAASACATPARSSRSSPTSGTRLYEKVDPAKAARIAGEDAVKGTPAKDLLDDANAAFFAKQRKIVLENSGRIDPERIESCVAEGAYEALQKAVTEMTPLDVIQQITASGLRGRGGGGYPTGLKWSTVFKAKGAKKFVICNADEGDPGAFMDRSVLEGDPHRVLEGMAIAAFAIGADQGYVYVRGEYPLAIERLKTAIKQAERQQFLGGRIFDTGFSFRVDIRIGAGAFVCGEETALIASIEGSRGTPRPRPPYPAISGLWGHPTLINNVETYANVAADRPQRRQLVRRRSAPRRARARRCSRWPARSRAPGWSRCRWACRCARSSSTSAAASPAARSSRPRRPAAPPAAASPRSTSTCRSTTSRWPASARSWARAA